MTRGVVAEDAAETREQSDLLELQREHRLIQRAQRGDLDALRPILEKYADPLYATVIMPRLGNTAAAEDVLRDTFLTAVTKLGSFQWQGRGIYGWLRQIAVNKAYDVHRRTRRQRKLVDAIAAEAPVETAPETRPDAVLIASQERETSREKIDEALGAISERYRTAITLRLIEELSREECAARLDVTVGTFDVLLYRAVRAFRKHFGPR